MYMWVRILVGCVLAMNTCTHCVGLFGIVPQQGCEAILKRT